MMKKRKQSLFDLDNSWSYQAYVGSFQLDFGHTANVHRVFCLERFKFNLLLQDKTKSDSVYLYSNVYGNWSFAQLALEEQDVFAFDVIQPGVYEFAIAILDHNENMCHWLPMAYQTLFVDPLACQGMNVYTFIPTISGNYKEWLNDFIQIKEMGFDCIHLLPIARMDTSQSPYACSDSFEVDPAYCAGETTKAVLKELVFFCVKHEIRLCVDLVFNHVGVHHKICQETPHWVKLDSKSGDGLKRAGCWHGENWVVWNDLVLLNYDHPNEKIKSELFEYMKDYALFWAKVADSTKGMIRYDNLHSSNFEFIKYVTRNIKEKFPDLVVLSELFCASDVRDKYRIDSHSNLLFATPWMNPYASDLRKEIVNMHDQFNSINYLFPISSHDSPSAFEMYGSHEASVTRYAVHAFFGLGATGIAQGLEHKIEKKIPFIGSVVRIEKTIDDTIAMSLKKINALIKKYKSFSVRGNYNFIDHHHPALVAGIRIGASVEEPDFLLIANLNSSHAEYIRLEEEILQHFTPMNLINDKHVDLYNLLEVNPGNCFILRSK